MPACVIIFLLGVINVSAAQSGNLSYDISEIGEVTITNCDENISDDIERCKNTCVIASKFTQQKNRESTPNFV